MPGASCGMDGKYWKVLLHLALGQKESHAGWLEFLRNLVARGLTTPVTITSDGAPGLLRAIDEVWSRSLRLRYWVHTIRNVLDKVPDSARAEVKAHVLSVCDALRWRRASKRPQTSWSGTGGCIPRQWPVSATIWRRG